MASNSNVQFNRKIKPKSVAHNMTTDCSLNYKFNTWKFQAQTWGEHVVYINCLWHSEQFLYTTCSSHVLQKEELLTKIYLYIFHIALQIVLKYEAEKITIFALMNCSPHSTTNFEFFNQSDRFQEQTAIDKQARNILIIRKKEIRKLVVGSGESRLL